MSITDACLLVFMFLVGIGVVTFAADRYGSGGEPWINVLVGFFMARCEACGRWFWISKGYVERGEYCYCSQCCHW